MAVSRADLICLVPSMGELARGPADGGVVGGGGGVGGGGRGVSRDRKTSDCLGRQGDQSETGWWREERGGGRAIPSGIIPAPCLKVEEFIPESPHARASYVHLGTTWHTYDPHTTTMWQMDLKDYTITQTLQTVVGRTMALP